MQQLEVYHLKQGDYIRLIRERSNIKQYTLLPDRHRSQSAKVEKNKVVFTIDLLRELSRNMGVTLEEFMHISEFDTQDEYLLHKYRHCIKYSDREQDKKEFLIIFNNLYSKKMTDLTINQSKLLFTIRATLSLYWEEIPKLSHLDVKNMYDSLIKKDFFSQYDYMVLCNGATLFSLEQLENLVKKGFPVYLNQKRNSTTKSYSLMFMLNVISINIYKGEYKKALYYTELLERHREKTRDYYTQINILYLKNICLGFLNNDNRFFLKAYNTIDIMKEVGDTKAANQLENELNALISNPTIYANEIKNLEYVKVDSFD